MSTAAAVIPTIDFSVYNLDQRTIPSDGELGDISTQIGEAMEKYRAFYLMNSGIEYKQVETLWDKVRAFCTFPVDVKMKYLLTSESAERTSGYSSPGIGAGFGVEGKPEIVNTAMETFTYFPGLTGAFWPSDEIVPGLMDEYNKTFGQGQDLSKRLLECLSLSYGRNRGFFTQALSAPTEISNESLSNPSAVTVNIYQHIPEEQCSVDVDVVRFPAHTDWSVLTTVVQNDRGLQVQIGDKWVDAPPKDGCVLVMAGSALEEWTSGRYPASMHRALALKDAAPRPRSVAVIFLKPDHRVLVGPLGGDMSTAVTYQQYSALQWKQYSNKA